MWIILVGVIIGLGYEAYRQHRELADFINSNEKKHNLPLD
jgi:hypothetical protein